MEEVKKSKITTETIYKVYDDDKGTFIEIGPHKDGLDLIEVVIPDKASQDFFGKAQFILSKEMAIAVGEALINAAKNIKE